MASDLGRLESDPLFLGLTRPTMVFGVTYLWVMAEGMGSFIYFINTNSFAGLFVIGILGHLVGIFIHAKDARFLEIAMVWAKTWPKCTNRKYYKGNASYDLT